MKSVLLIGPRGLLGASLMRELRAVGFPVETLDRGDPMPDGHFDVVLDCNGESRRFWCNQHPQESFDANVASVMARLTALNFDQYVFFSTVDVYGPNRADPARSVEDSPLPTQQLDVYAYHKQMAEALVGFHARQWLVMRLGTLIGPGLKKNPVFDAVNGLPIRVRPESTLSLVHSAFVAEALVGLLARGAQGVWNVAGSPITIAAILDAVRAHGLGGPPEWHEEVISLEYAVNTEKLRTIIAPPSSQRMLDHHLRFDVGAACMS